MEDSETTSHGRMTRLAEAFRSLRGAPGVRPFDPERLDRWAAGLASHGEAVTVRFLLSVWDPSHEWAAGRFDLMEALRVWDESHHETFLQWAADPWWP